MKRGAGICAFALLAIAIAAACSSPDYKFAAADAGQPTTSSSSSSSSSSGAAIVDAGIDAEPADFAPIAVPFGDDAGRNLPVDCGNVKVVIPTGVTSAYAQESDDGGLGAGHCFVFFFNSNYGRRWVDAQFACTQLTYGGKSARLATFSNAGLAKNVDAAYSGTIRTWIGLENIGDATQKSGFAWVDQTPFLYDGWAAGSPNGEPCVSWTGNAQWGAADCSSIKGFLCEFE